MWVSYYLFSEILKYVKKIFIFLKKDHEIYRGYPLKVALDVGFASKENLGIAKSKKIKDVCFAKKRDLEVAACNIVADKS